MRQRPLASRWPDLFEAAMSIIDQANEAGICIDDWTFGGGTALMLQIGHRESHDIDLFITDPQYLPYLNPETQDYDVALQASDYETDGIQALKIVYDGIGEIDFICRHHVTDQPARLAPVNGRQVRQELPAEIIAKKIVYRGASLQPRDMFDLAAVSIVLGEDAVVDFLLPVAEACSTAWQVARDMDPAFARSVMGMLAVRPGFEELPGSAQEIACRIFERVALEVERRKDDLGQSPL